MFLKWCLSCFKCSSPHPLRTDCICDPLSKMGSSFFQPFHGPVTVVRGSLESEPLLPHPMNSGESLVLHEMNDLCLPPPTAQVMLPWNSQITLHRTEETSYRSQPEQLFQRCKKPDLTACLKSSFCEISLRLLSRSNGPMEGEVLFLSHPSLSPLPSPPQTASLARLC